MLYAFNILDKKAFKFVGMVQKQAKEEAKRSFAKYFSITLSTLALTASLPLSLSLSSLLLCVKLVPFLPLLCQEIGLGWQRRHKKSCANVCAAAGR